MHTGVLPILEGWLQMEGKVSRIQAAYKNLLTQDRFNPTGEAVFINIWQRTRRPHSTWQKSNFLDNSYLAIVLSSNNFLSMHSLL